MRKSIWALAAGAVMAVVFAARQMAGPAPLPPDGLLRLWSDPLPAPGGPMATYHLGHSLVGRDMPALLAQMAGHDYALQLGWGASLMNHWKGDVPGFAVENATPAHRPVREALQSGDYPVLVLTEMVELKDAVRYHDSADYLTRWARLAREGRGDIRIFLYETWHRLDDPAGWEARIAADRPALWEGEILARAMAREGVGRVHVIPGGPVMAAAVRAVEAGQVPGMAVRADLFGLNPDGSPDPIHFNTAGAYLMALTHYAVIYQRDPAGRPEVQPGALRLADGSPLPLAPETARALQALVWPVVRGYSATGVPRG